MINGFPLIKQPSDDVHLIRQRALPKPLRVDPKPRNRAALEDVIDGRSLFPAFVRAREEQGRLSVRVENPILLDAVLRILTPLQFIIPVLTAGRHDLNGKVWRTID